jgi:DNA polymerase III subunit delta'
VLYSPPMSRDQIIGHKKQLLQLEQDLVTGNLSHAYLFSGPANVGKTMVARWFAKEILMRDVADGDREQASHAIDNLFHQDILMLDQLWMEEKMEDWDFIAQSSNLPQQHRSKAGLKTDTIAVDDIREIQQRVNETGDLPHRVCIIRGIERMQDAAANAFLKTLEEPPAGRVFILSTDAASDLLPTIISRSRVIRFERVGDREVQSLLSDLEQPDASFITHIAQGAPGLALTLRDDPDALRDERLLHTQAIAFWEAQSLHDRLTYGKPLLERGADANRFMFHLALALRQKPDAKRTQERSLQQLTEALTTNANRGLITQRFAMSV